MTVIEKLKELSVWPIFAATISFLVIFLVGLSIFLSNKWSILPIIAAVLFLFILGMNPIGRYFRLLVSVVASWSLVAGGSSIDFGIDLKAYGFAWLKTNDIPAYAHFAFLGLVIVFVIADVVSRPPSSSRQSHITENRLKKHKLNLLFFSYLFTFSGVTAATVILNGKAEIWNPLSGEPIYHQEVSIDRVADFRQSGCSESGERKDYAIFKDTVTLTNSDKIYFAFTMVDYAQYVDVYDLSIDENEPITPTTKTMIYGKPHYTYPISVNSSKQAKVKYVWKSSHYDPLDPNHGMLGIGSKSYLKAASAQILLPDGKRPTSVDEPFGSNYQGSCKSTNDGGFVCTDLKNPDVVLFSFGWEIWATCQGS